MNSQPDGKPNIIAGDILVEKSALLPEPLQLGSDLAGNGWARVASNHHGHEFEKKLAAAGWTFFFMAGAIRTIGFGFGRPAMIQAALQRLTAIVRLQKCNCMQIEDVQTHSFLGLRYVSISAHSRHIQPGLAFQCQ